MSPRYQFDDMNTVKQKFYAFEEKNSILNASFFMKG